MESLGQEAVKGQLNVAAQSNIAGVENGDDTNEAVLNHFRRGVAHAQRPDPGCFGSGPARCCEKKSFWLVWFGLMLTDSKYNG